MTFMKLDLSSLASVRAFVAEFKASKLNLDSLILNAGVMHAVRALLPVACTTSLPCLGSRIVNHGAPG